jgi:hypothetical protein
MKKESAQWEPECTISRGFLSGPNNRTSFVSYFSGGITPARDPAAVEHAAGNKMKETWRAFAVQRQFC